MGRKVTRDGQLGVLQRRILMWVYEQQAQSALAPVVPRAVPWSAKRFFNAAPTNAQSATLSKALHSLEARGLVVLESAAGGRGEKLRTDRVGLTRPGRLVATELLRNQGLSASQLEDLERLKLLREQVVEARTFTEKVSKNRDKEARRQRREYGIDGVDMWPFDSYLRDCQIDLERLEEQAARLERRLPREYRENTY